MSRTRASLEHRARELLNLAQMSERCARLPDTDPSEQKRWHREARRALEAVKALLPDLAAEGGTAREVVSLAARTAVDMERERERCGGATARNATPARCDETGRQ